ncbi:MAG: DUF362 domain-containing protein [Verrucomicrobiota bacterium]|nr:DUF362 domain-containing protein [Verrucomicrobiota bacterium]
MTTYQVPSISRRKFIHHSMLGAAALAALPLLERQRLLGAPVTPASKVALTHGGDQADNIYKALQYFRGPIARSIQGRRVIIKPNCVMDQDQPTWHANGAYVERSNTNVKVLEGILEFLKSIGIDQVTIAESCAYCNTFTPMETLGYFNLAKRYKVKFVDMNQEAFDETDVYSGATTKKVRVSRVISDPGNYIISAARMKTHDSVVATLSLKNIGMSSPIQDVSKKRKDKGTMHGNADANVPGTAQNLNDNLTLLAKRGIRPHLAVVDAYEGIEDDGPIFGLPVEHRVAVASLDFLAADRVCCELMGLTDARADYQPAYLKYCAQEGLGTFDLSQIEVVGEKLSDHLREYKLHSQVEWEVSGLSPITRSKRALSKAPVHQTNQTYEMGPDPRYKS